MSEITTADCIEWLTHEEKKWGGENTEFLRIASGEETAKLYFSITDFPHFEKGEDLDYHYSITEHGFFAA